MQRKMAARKCLFTSLSPLGTRICLISYHRLQLQRIVDRELNLICIRALLVPSISTVLSLQHAYNYLYHRLEHRSYNYNLR